MQAAKIIEEQDIIINGANFHQVIYANGSSVLKKYSEKHKMFITLKFPKDDDPNAIKKAKEIATLSIIV